MIEIEKPKIEPVEINDDASYGKFVVEPLERGYGTTLGNSLRRILLSSLPGSAVTSAQFDTVLHEFSTIEGVTEDVTTIILNLKKLALKIYSDEEKTLEVEAQGEGVQDAGMTGDLRDGPGRRAIDVRRRAAAAARPVERLHDAARGIVVAPRHGGSSSTEMNVRRRGGHAHGTGALATGDAAKPVP